MFRLTIRSLLAKKLRLFTTALAIVLGVAFTAGTMILADTMTASFSSAIEDIGDGVDTVVLGEPLDASDPMSPAAPLPVGILDAVRSVPGVAVAAPYWESYAEVIGADGKALDLMQSVGLNWIDDADLTMFRMVDGAPPASPDQVVLETSTLDEAGLGIGDHVDVMTRLGRTSFTVSGTAEFAGGASLGGTAFVFFDDEAAAVHLAEPGQMSAVFARGVDGADQDRVTAAIAGVTPGAEVRSGAEQVAQQQDDISSAIGVFETILMVFGVIALFVGSFTIANTFTITIAQRTRELALVRAVGASRRQVLGSVVAEAAVLGVVAAAVGLAGGLGVAVGLTKLFAAIGLEFPSRAPVVAMSTVVVSLVAGIVVTVGAALLPARRAASVAPVDAMRDASIERSDSSRRRTVVGAVMAVVGVAGLVAGASGGSAPLVGLAAVAAFGAVLALGPVLVRPVTALLAAPMRRLGAAGRLAAANATRNPKRSSATAAALTVGVMLVAGAAMFASTAKETVSGDVDDVVVANAVIRPLGASWGLPTTIAESAAASGVADSVVPMQQTMARLDGEPGDIAGLDLAASSEVLALSVLEGDLATDGLAVGDRTAESRGWTVGTVVDVTFADGASIPLSVGAVFEQTTAVSSVVAPYEVVAPHGDGLDQLVFVSASPSGLVAIESALLDVPTATVESAAEYAASLAGTLDMVLNLVFGFLGLAVVIAVLGIATTIGLSVHERTRELGVLRAVGMTRRQLRRSIRLESIVIALFGTVLGLALGVGCTWAALTTLSDDGFVAPVVPIGTLVAVVIGALAAGTLAAALPARRAARRAVLEAIRTE